MLLIFRYRHHLNNFTNTLRLPFVGQITENEYYKVETHHYGSNVYHCMVQEHEIEIDKLPVECDHIYRFGSEKMNSVEQLEKKLGIRLDARQKNKIRTMIFNQMPDAGEMVEILGGFLFHAEQQVRNELVVQREREREMETERDNSLLYGIGLEIPDELEFEEEVGDYVSHSPQARSSPGENGKKITKRIRSDTCVICMDKPSDITFAECGHESCCEDCAMKVDSCPLCRKKTRNLIK